MSFTNILIMTTNFIPILLSFYIGSWSDRFGRKPFIGAALSISVKKRCTSSCSWAESKLAGARALTSLSNIFHGIFLSFVFVLFLWQTPLSSYLYGCPSPGSNWQPVGRGLSGPNVQVVVAGPLHPHTNPRSWTLHHDVVQLHSWQLQATVFRNNIIEQWLILALILILSTLQR